MTALTDPSVTRSQRHQVQLRWGDQDLNGHVNNARIMDYLQEARIAFLHSPRTDAGYVIRSITVQYLRPVHFRFASLTVTTEVTRVGSSSFTLRQQGTHSDAALFTAEVTVVAFSRSTQSKRTLDSADLELLQVPSN